MAEREREVSDGWLAADDGADPLRAGGQCVDDLAAALLGDVRGVPCRRSGAAS